MVKSIDDLQEGFYLCDERVRSPLIHLCYVRKKDGKWFAYKPGGGSVLEQFEQEIGDHMLAAHPLFFEGPIDPKTYLEQHNNNLRKFIESYSK